MNLLPEEDAPVPYGLAWRLAHRDRHLAAFPDTDATTIANLQLLIEDARIREAPAV